MARNAIESYFRTSKMAAGGHFVKNLKKIRMDLKWPEMPSKMNFGHPKWPPKKNAIECEFQTSKMADRQPKWLLDLKWPEMPSKVIFAVGHFVKKRSVWR